MFLVKEYDQAKLSAISVYNMYLNGNRIFFIWTLGEILFKKKYTFGVISL